MAEVKEPKPKPVPLKKAYENAKELRKLLRELNRCCGLDKADHYAPAKKLSQAKAVTNTWVGMLGAGHKAQIEQALVDEREAAAAAGAQTGHLASLVAKAYTLVQVLPSWDGMPEGESANKLRAVEALVKTSNSPHLAIESIKVILGVKKIEPPKPVPMPMPKPPKVKALPNPIVPKVVNPTTGLPMSPYHLHPVSIDEMGYEVAYYMIKKGTPMTWGEKHVWMDKGHQKPGESGTKYFIHPMYATASHKAYHEGLNPPDKPAEEAPAEAPVETGASPAYMFILADLKAMEEAAAKKDNPF